MKSTPDIVDLRIEKELTIYSGEWIYCDLSASQMLVQRSK